MRNNLTVRKINAALAGICRREDRRFIPIKAAYYEAAANYLNFVGGNVGSYARVRSILARRLGVRDCYSGNPGRRAGGRVIGHFVPDECLRLPD